MITKNEGRRMRPGGGGGVAPVEVWRARGKRLTRPRRIILDVVRASDAHPSALMVYRQVRRRLPRVSLATVYRNLRMLAAEGVLSERATAAGTASAATTPRTTTSRAVPCGG